MNNIVAFILVAFTLSGCGTTGKDPSHGSYGEDFDAMKHTIKVGVKAATYHMLKLDKSDDGFKAQVILDI